MKSIKKAVFALILINSIFMFTSCDVHFGSIHYDVPWYTIVIIDVIVIAAITLIAGVALSKNTYKCPDCGEELSPKWYRAAFTMHDGSSRVFKCPKCGRKGFCRKV